jgi:glycosyltransferase involved in cell wall biosynthesis
MKTICIIAPIHNEESNINLFYDRVSAVLDQTDLDWRILFINDGSSDNSQQILDDLSKNNNRIQLLSFTRNFGKESAITAGLDYAHSDAVIPIDTDLQDPPELMLDMIKYWQQGFDIVYAKRRDRAGETFIKLLTANLFYKFINKFSDITIHNNVGDYRLLSRRVVGDINKMREKNRFMKGIFCWVGYSSKEILFDRDKRNAGDTSFHFLKLFNLALDGITSFSVAPLRIFFYTGLFILLLSFTYASYIIIETIIFGVKLPGYASLLVVILFLGGLNLFAIGFVGEYIGRIYQEVKDRPVYLIKKENEKK